MRSISYVNWEWGRFDLEEALFDVGLSHDGGSTFAGRLGVFGRGALE